jgi:hypothetical protein
MSFHRENAIWQGRNGRWHCGFYRVTWVPTDDLGEDATEEEYADADNRREWDAEYDFDQFESVYSADTEDGLETVLRRSDRPKPAASDLYLFDHPYWADVVDNLDAMATDWSERHEAWARARGSTNDKPGEPWDYPTPTWDDLENEHGVTSPTV